VSGRAWFLFGIVSVLWGVPYLFIKIAVDDGVPPVFLAWVRVALAAALLGALAWRAGLLPSLRGRWRWITTYAFLELVFPMPLIAAGEQWISSSLAAILIAAVPLIVALLALRFDHSERVEGARLLGLLVGFAGVIALVGIDVAGDTWELLGTAAVLTAAVGYAAGPMLLRRKLAALDPRALMAASLTIATLALAPAALAAPPPATALTAEAIVGLVVLGVFCTAAAFVLFGHLVLEIGAGRATVITYVSPVIAIAAGMAVLGERPGIGAVAGLVLIIAGSWLATTGRLPAALASGRARGRDAAAEAEAR
jgi:drug/metabolite transporter (DMT)-like permease